MARLYIDENKFPPLDTSKEEYTFSPVLSLEPHGYQFKQPVLVRFPFSAVPGGWHLSLLRAKCQAEKVEKTWKEIVTYNSDSGEVTTDDCQFDIGHSLLGVTHFCDHCWRGQSILVQGFSTACTALHIQRRKLLYCSVFGHQPETDWNRWILELYLHDYCRHFLGSQLCSSVVCNTLHHVCMALAAGGFERPGTITPRASWWSRTVDNSSKW